MIPRAFLLALLGTLTLLLTPTAAQFGNIFEQMFGGGSSQQHSHGGKQNVASDSKWYQETWSNAQCTNYLCPGTMACVHFPHHCPCPFSDVEDKVELGEGSAVCISRGGWKDGEAARKIELARKGLL